MLGVLCFGGQVHMFEMVQGFITAMDALRLNTRAVDEIAPMIRDIVNSCNKLSGPLKCDMSRRMSCSNNLRHRRHGCNKLLGPSAGAQSRCFAAAGTFGPPPHKTRLTSGF